MRRAGSGLDLRAVKTSLYDMGDEEGSGVGGRRKDMILTHLSHLPGVARVCALMLAFILGRIFTSAVAVATPIAQTNPMVFIHHIPFSVSFYALSHAAAASFHRTQLTFEVRKMLHMLFIPLIIALCFHTPALRLAGAILLTWYILDRLYFTIWM